MRVVEKRTIRALRKKFLDHLAVDVGQSEIPPLKAIGQFQVIDATQVENGGLEVVDVNAILCGEEP